MHLHQEDYVFFFQAEDGIRDLTVTGVQTCALPICDRYSARAAWWGERDGRRERGARRRRGPEPGVPLDHARLAPPEAVGRRLRDVGRADGGRSALWPAAPPRPLLRRRRDIGRGWGPQSSR